MCQLKKLKKKIHFKKLLAFLNLYPYVLFYHSLKEHRGKTGPFMDRGVKVYSVLFLVNGARLRKFSLGAQGNQGGLMKKDTSNVSPVCDTIKAAQKTDGCELAKQHKQIKPVRVDKHGNNLERVQEMLCLVTRGGAMGSTFFLGCESLENMQKCINKFAYTLPLDFICLGGIYDTLYIDPRECLRLEQIKAQAVHKELIRCSNQGAVFLVQQLASPALRLDLCIKWRQQ